MGHVPKLIDTLSGLFDNFLSNSTRFEYRKSGQTRHFEFDCLTWLTALYSLYRITAHTWHREMHDKVKYPSDTYYNLCEFLENNFIQNIIIY